MGIKFKTGTKRPDKSNAIDLLVSGELPKSGPEREGYEGFFDEVPAEFTEQEREEWMSKLTQVAVSSDAFVSLRYFPSIILYTTNMTSSHSSTMSTVLQDQVLSTSLHQVAVKMIHMSLKLLKSLTSHLSSKAFVCSTTKLPIP